MKAHFEVIRLTLMPSRNHPDQEEDALMRRAVEILSAPPPGDFVVKHWSEIMPKANADAKSKEMKAAAKKIVAKGVTKPRHRALTSTKKMGFPDNPYHSDTKPSHEGVDTDDFSVVHSEDVAKSGALNQMKDTIMTSTTTPGTDGVAKAAELKAEKEAIKARKAAEREAAKAAAKAEKEAKQAEAKAKREADKAARDAEKAAAKASKPPRERTYAGSMLTLADRVAAGVYTKGANGQLRSSDDVAIALESIPAKRMVAFLLEFLGLPFNPYATLNYGQQSMNLRNRLRGVLKQGHIVVTPAVKAVKEVKDEAGNVVTPAVAAVPAVTKPVTIEDVKAARDAGNWTAQPEPEKKAEAKELAEA